MSDLIERARATAEHLRETQRPDDTADLIDQLCDALEECGYDLVGQWAARFPVRGQWWTDALVIPAANQAAARELVAGLRVADQRWDLVHRPVGPWRKADDA